MLLVRACLLLFVTLGVVSMPYRFSRGAEPGDAVKTELKNLQGLWQTSPGGMEHRDGSQVVRNPMLEGPCFFVQGDRLIWLDADGKPTGETLKITLNVKADPKQITFTSEGDADGKKPLRGIYGATASSWIMHIGLDGSPAPKSFLELNNPVKGNDGSEWLVRRKKLQGE